MQLICRRCGATVTRRNNVIPHPQTEASIGQREEGRLGLTDEEGHTLFFKNPGEWLYATHVITSRPGLLQLTNGRVIAGRSRCRVRGGCCVTRNGQERRLTESSGLVL